MKRIMGSLGFVLLWAAPGLAADARELKGAWIATAATQNGKQLPDEFVTSAKLNLGDGKYTASLGEITDEGTFKVDRSKKPNTIDMTSSGGGAKKGRAMLGIFELDGDTLRICWSLETNQRPSNFTSTDANKHFVVIYKRKK